MEGNGDILSWPSVKLQAAPLYACRALLVLRRALHWTQGGRGCEGRCVCAGLCLCCAAVCLEEGMAPSVSPCSQAVIVSARGYREHDAHVRLQGCSCAGRRWAWGRAWRPARPPTCWRAWWTRASARAPPPTCSAASTSAPSWGCSSRPPSSRPSAGRRCASRPAPPQLPAAIHEKHSLETYVVLRSHSGQGWHGFELRGLRFYAGSFVQMGGIMTGEASPEATDMARRSSTALGRPVCCGAPGGSPWSARWQRTTRSRTGC